MKMQKSVIFAKKIENKYVKDEKYCKVRDQCLYTGKYGGAAHSISNLKYSVHKKAPITFHYESNDGYYFYHKRVRIII